MKFRAANVRTIKVILVRTTSVVVVMNLDDYATSIAAGP
jgi:hypothetical protein